jgi:hypothetical protein
MQTKNMEMEKQELATAPAPISNDTLIMYLENLGLLKDLTTGEKNTYLQIAKAFNLNPFKREIWVSKYSGQMSIITGYEVYIKRAERTGQLDGWHVETSGSVEAGDLKATITIYRKDRSKPFVWETLYSEYVQKTSAGVVTKFWQKAHTMTKKVAISQGFRLCFSDELGGMPYTSDELPETTPPVDIEHEVMPEAPAAETKQAKRAAPIVKERVQPPPAAFTESLRDELKSLLYTAAFEDEGRRQKALTAIAACGNMGDYTNIKLALLKFQSVGAMVPA